MKIEVRVDLLRPYSERKTSQNTKQLLQYSDGYFLVNYVYRNLFSLSHPVFTDLYVITSKIAIISSFLNILT